MIDGLLKKMSELTDYMSQHEGEINDAYDKALLQTEKENDKDKEYYRDILIRAKRGDIGQDDILKTINQIKERWEKAQQ
jgi:hypothetical protein